MDLTSKSTSESERVVWLVIIYTIDIHIYTQVIEEV